MATAAVFVVRVVGMVMLLMPMLMTVMAVVMMVTMVVVIMVGAINTGVVDWLSLSLDLRSGIGEKIDV